MVFVCIYDEHHTENGLAAVGVTAICTSVVMKYDLYQKTVVTVGV